MRERNRVGPGYAKVDYKPNEYVESSSWPCPSKGRCNCSCGHCYLEDHRFCGHGNDCHVGC